MEVSHHVTDTTTGVSTAVPEEHRANGTSQGDRQPVSRAKSVGTPVLQTSRAAWLQAGSKLSRLRGASQELSTSELDHTTARVDHTNTRHPVIQLTRDLHGAGMHHKTQMMLWHLMREFVPVLDAAIENRRRIEGDLVIQSEDEGLQEELRDWWESVPVGYLGEEASLQGGDFYLNMLAQNADEYGMGVGETLLTSDARDVRRLVVPNMRTISTADRDQDDIYEVYQNEPDQLEREGVDIGQLNRLDNRPTVDVLAFRASTETEWPYPLAWSLKRVAEAFLRIVDSTINGWWRFGDPSMHFNLQFDADADIGETTVSQGSDDEESGSDVTVPEALVWLKDGMSQVMDARREGKVGDMYSYVDGGELSQEVIGNVENTLMQYVKEHQGHIAAQVIEHSETPPWMYSSVQQTGDGLGSERSTNMALVAATAAGKRNRLKKRVARGVLDTLLTVRGDSQFVGQYDLWFDRLGIIDEKVQAEADLTSAKADQQAAKVAGLAFGPDGERRFSGEAESYLERNDVYQSEE